MLASTSQSATSIRLATRIRTTGSCGRGSPRSSSPCARRPTAYTPSQVQPQCAIATNLLTYVHINSLLRLMLGSDPVDTLIVPASAPTHARAASHRRACYSCAKVSRDIEIQEWKFKEQNFSSNGPLGSGYPAGLPAHFQRPYPANLPALFPYGGGARPCSTHRGAPVLSSTIIFLSPACLALARRP